MHSYMLHQLTTPGSLSLKTLELSTQANQITPAHQRLVNVALVVGGFCDRQQAFHQSIQSSQIRMNITRIQRYMKSRHSGIVPYPHTL